MAASGGGDFFQRLMYTNIGTRSSLLSDFLLVTAMILFYQGLSWLVSVKMREDRWGVGKFHWSTTINYFMHQSEEDQDSDDSDPNANSILTRTTTGFVKGVIVFPNPTDVSIMFSNLK